MVFSKVFLSIFIIIFFKGCGFQPNKLVYNEEINKNYEVLVNQINKNFKQCYTKKPKGIYIGTYIVKETYKIPEYTKFTLYIDSHEPQFVSVLGTITVFRDKVYINQRGVGFLKDIKQWYLEGMECNNGKK